MAGTRTAPTVNGTPNKVLISFSVIDASGDLTTLSYLIPSLPLDADIESLVAAYQAATQASVYSVNVQSIYEGDIDPDNATANERSSVKDGVNELWRDTTTWQTQSPRLVAPITAVMQGNQDIPLFTAAEYIALIAAEGVILADYAFQSGQYTERRERKNNPRIRA